MSTPLPYLLLSTRPEDDAAAGEYESFRTLLGVQPHELLHRRVEQQPLGQLRLSDYRGILIGGGPYNNTDEDKTPTQLRVEAELNAVVLQAIEQDFPLFAACYGIGVVGTAIGASVDRTSPEEAGVIEIRRCDNGTDPLLGDLPEAFAALVGHKENVSSLPQTVSTAAGIREVNLLATGQACRIQMFTVGTNVYVTQFHPELDLDSFALRLKVYKDAGYFPAEEASRILEAAAREDLSQAPNIIRRFAQLCDDHAQARVDAGRIPAT